MLQRKNRLVLEKEIQKVLKNSKPFITKFFNFKTNPNELPQSRFCIIVSKKVHKSAVKRNRLKRQVGEIIRLNLKKIKVGFDLAITIKSSIVDKKTDTTLCDYHEMEKNILWALEKMRLITSPK